MKNRLTIHYIIGIAALAVTGWALYLLSQDLERTRSLILTIIGGIVVAVGQFLIIRQKKSKNRN